MSHLSFSWKRRRDLAAVSFICPPISSLQNSLLGGEQGGEWSRVCRQRSGPLPKTRKTRHLVHTWQDTDVLEPADKVLRGLGSRLHASSSPPLSAPHLFGTSIFANMRKRSSGDELTSYSERCSITLTPKTCGTSPPTQSLRLRICCVPERKTEEEKWKVESEVRSQLQKTCCSSWRRISSSSNGRIPNSQKTDQN